MYHNPVLIQESISGLDVRPGGTYIDATFGGGGHSRAILERLQGGRLIAFDQDEESLGNSIRDERFCLINRNFRYMIHFLRYLKAMAVDGILADLGISSHQIDTPSRGFSTRFEGPIDLRMDRKLKISARDILNSSTEDRLDKIFSAYGELDNHRRVASLIIHRRSTQALESTADLVNCLKPAIPANREKQFLAQVFQALRIEVNREMEALQEFLLQAIEVLNPGGRLVVISYHSLEDRMVKNFIRSGNPQGIINKDFYGNIQNRLRAITRKPICPSVEEQQQNPRSRSAKLRIAEKL